MDFCWYEIEDFRWYEIDDLFELVKVRFDLQVIGMVFAKVIGLEMLSDEEFFDFYD